jgi:hypothetical protein
MNTFATLLGSNRTDDRLKPIFGRLHEIAVKAGFQQGDSPIQIHRDQIPIDDWDLEQLGPDGDTAAFLLAVTAPRSPSISPLPIRQTIHSPLFSVVVMPEYFGIWSEGRPGDTFIETKDERTVEDEFRQFLSGMETGLDTDRRNSNICPSVPSEPVDGTPAIAGPVCQFCKKRPGHVEQRISPPMRVVEIVICDECSRSIIY